MQAVKYPDILEIILKRCSCIIFLFIYPNFAMADRPIFQSLPFKFYDLGQMESLKANEPDPWIGYESGDPELQDELNFFALWIHSGIATYVSGGTLHELWKKPFKLVTGSLEDDAIMMLSTVNRTVIVPGHPSKYRGRLAFNFDLIDLFGCKVDSHLYTLIDNLDSFGTLILPFNGVDFSRLKKLPKRIEKLVIYNSIITDDLDRLLQSTDDLTEVVLWGCVVPDARNEKDSSSAPLISIFLPNLCQRVKKLTLINCDKHLMRSIYAQKFPNLECLEFTGRFAPQEFISKLLDRDGRAQASRDRFGNLKKIKHFVYKPPIIAQLIPSQIANELVAKIGIKNIEVEVVCLNTRIVPWYSNFAISEDEGKDTKQIKP